MRFRMKTGLRAAKWTLALVSFGVFSESMTSVAQAHHPHFRHCGHFGLRHFGYGLGYSSFGYSPYWNRGFSTSYYGFSSPFYYAPRYYSYSYAVPYISLPINSYYYQPGCPTFWSGVNYGSALPLASNQAATVGPAWATASRPTASWPTASWPTAVQGNVRLTSNVPTMPASRASLVSQTRQPSVSTGLTADAPLMMLRDASGLEDRAGVRIIANKPVGLQPYSPIWTQAAVGLVDDMIQEGRLEDANLSCKAMEKIEQTKGSGVYLRQALLNYFSQDSSSSVSPDDVLNLLNEACAAGSGLSPSELSKESLSDYFSACSVDVSRSLEILSKTILDDPAKAGREMLLLTALLKMDGQTERAKLFADEADQLASKSISFRWNSLLAVCKE
jgi:hypothetical protein